MAVSRIEIKPNTPKVGSPVDARSPASRSAWKARKASAWPSINSSVGRRSVMVLPHMHASVPGIILACEHMSNAPLGRIGHCCYNTLRCPPPSSSGQGRHPFKVEITGSNPVGGTKRISENSLIGMSVCRNEYHGIQKLVSRILMHQQERRPSQKVGVLVLFFVQY